MHRRSEVQCAAVPQFSVGQAAELLRVSPDTVRRLADRGEFNSSRTLGGRRLVDEAVARDAQRAASAALVSRRVPTSAVDQRRA